jgi:hypothetical protein
MENSDRLKALKELRRPNVDVGFKTSQDFTEWQGRIAPFLNFSENYHRRFMDVAGKTFDVSGLPARRRFYRQLDSIIAQAITELERGLTPKREVQLTDEHGLWWFLTHGKSKVQLRFLGLLLSAFLIGLGFGSNHFFMSLYNLVKSSATPSTNSVLTTTMPTKK